MAEAEADGYVAGVGRQQACPCIGVILGPYRVFPKFGVPFWGYP